MKGTLGNFDYEQKDGVFIYTPLNNFFEKSNKFFLKKEEKKKDKHDFKVLGEVEEVFKNDVSNMVDRIKDEVEVLVRS